MSGRGPFAPAVALATGILVAAVLATAAALCLVCANVAEPRHAGKAAVLAALAAAAPRYARHATPSVLAATPAAAAAAATSLGGRVVVKPNELTSCALGVMVADDAAAAAAAAAQLLQPLAPHGVGVLVQRYVGPAVEARLYGVRGSRGWRWDPVVWAAAPAARAAVTVTPMAPPLAEELDGMMAAVYPDVSAAALDVRAPSLDALQRGEFYVLELNGAFGIAHTWRDRDTLPASLAAMARDIVRWAGPRLALGARHIVRGDVNVGSRVAREWQWVRASRDAQRALRNIVPRADIEDDLI